MIQMKIHLFHYLRFEIIGTNYNKNKQVNQQQGKVYSIKYWLSFFSKLITPFVLTMIMIDLKCESTTNKGYFKLQQITK